MESHHGQTAFEPPRFHPSQAISRPARALVVDDDIRVLDPIVKMVAKLDFHVDKASDSITAMTMLSVAQYNLMITDFDLSGLNGFRLAKWLKQKAPATTVVIMTGRCQAEVAGLIQTGIVDAWLFKPFNFDELIQTLTVMDNPCE